MLPGEEWAGTTGNSRRVRLRLPRCPPTFSEFLSLLESSDGRFLIRPDGVVTVAPHRARAVQDAFPEAEILPYVSVPAECDTAQGTDRQHEFG